MADEWGKLWFRITESEVFADASLLKVWIWCLCKTRRFKRWVPVSTGRGVTRIELGPGQFLFGRQAAAKELRMPPTSVQRRMQTLADMGNVVIQPGSHFSIVTVCNYERYQASDGGDGQTSGHPTGQQRVSNGQATGQQRSQKESTKTSKSTKSTRDASCSEASPEPEFVLTFPVVGGVQTEWGLTAAKRDEYVGSFPGVDVMAELRAARQWCRDNSTRRKTPGGMLKFLSAWLVRSQNQAKGKPNDQNQRSGRFRSGTRDPDAEASRYR